MNNINKRMAGNTFGTSSHAYVDVHGRNLRVMVGEDNAIYVPLAEVKKAGFHIFPESAFNINKVGKTMVLAEFQLYMLAKAKKYLIQNNIHSINQEDIINTIDACRQQYLKEFKDGNSNGVTVSSGLLGRTLLANPTVVQQEVRSAYQQNLQQRHSAASTSRYPENSDNASFSRESFGRAKDSLRNNSSFDSNKNTSFENLRDNQTSPFSNPVNAQITNRTSNFPNNLTPATRVLNRSLNNSRNDSDSDSKTPTFERIKLQHRMQKVKVVHVEKFNEKLKYWLQLVENSTKVEEIFIECQDCYETAPVVTPKVGEICLAMSREDECWYRCVVKKATPLIKINFIDFGNEEVVKEVRQLPKKLREIPAQAVRTTFPTLEGATSPQLAVDDVVQVEFIKEFQDSTLLVKMVNWKQETAKVAQIENIFMEEVKFSTALVDSEMVKIIAFSDDGKLYLRNKEHYNMLVNVTTEIKEYKAERLTNVAPGQVVLCQRRGEDNIESLCRAIVRNVENDAVKVQYIDYYTTASVPKSSLFAISKKIANLPTSLIESPIIRNFNAAKFNETAKKHIQKAIIDRSKFNVVSGIDFDLLLNNQSSLSDKLFPIEVSLRLPKTSPLKARVSEPKQYVKLKYDELKQYEVPLGLGEYMLNTAKNSDDFTITPTTDEAMDLIGKCAGIEIKDDEPYEPENTEVILGLFEDEWYRGVSLRHNANGKFEILFVDFGNMSVLTKYEIRKIPLEYRKIPVMGLCCRIANVPDSEGVRKKFKELMKTDLIYDINIIGLDSGEMVYDVEVPQLTQELRKLDLI